MTELTKNEVNLKGGRSVMRSPDQIGITWEENQSLMMQLKEKQALENRRKNNIFEVGDKVVFEAHFCDEHKGSGYGEITYCTMDKRVFEIDNYYLVSIDEIRHATPEEIAAGHRIDANTDYVSDIRNHISPMTIVQGD